MLNKKENIKGEGDAMKNKEVNVNETVKKPKKKKGKKKWIAIGIAVVVVAAIVGIKTLGSAEVILPVTVTAAITGELAQNIETSGTVSSEEKKVYFSEVNAKIVEYKPVVGAIVKKGDMMISYDVEELELANRQAELDSKASNYGIDATLTSLNESQRKSAEAITNYDEAQRYVAHYNECVGQISAQLSEANKIQTELTALMAEQKELTAKLKKDPGNSKLEKKLKESESEIKKVNKKLENYNISELKSSLEVCSADLEEYKMKAKEYESMKEVDKSIDSQKAQQGALKEASKLTGQKTQKELELAKEGVTSAFNGIISSADAVEGQTVTAGTPLFTIESIEKVKVTISVSKYDLEKLHEGQKAIITINNKEYKGTVSNISRIAVENQQGAPMVNADIHIDNPDENIFLGVEAKVAVETARKAGVVMVPMECINSDTKGEFCYIVEDGKIVRKDVVCGISSDLYTEIVSGLAAGDKVVSEMNLSIVEGMKVTPVEADVTESGVTEADESTEVDGESEADESTEVGGESDIDEAAENDEEYSDDESTEDSAESGDDEMTDTNKNDASDKTE